MKFIPVESSNSSKWRIGIDNLDWAVGNNSSGCSFNVLGARLLNLTYSDYLKFLRSNGGELRGRIGYSYALFSNKTNCQKICSLLNREWDKIKKYVGE